MEWSVWDRIIIWLCRIEKEIFPEYKEAEMFLLEVTWQEDYVQKLGKGGPHVQKLGKGRLLVKKLY